MASGPYRPSIDEIRAIRVRTARVASNGDCYPIASVLKIRDALIESDGDAMLLLNV